MKTTILKKTDKIIAVCLVLFGLLYLYLARSLPFGTWNSPKTGFLPKLSGVLMVGFSVINLIFELRKPDEVPDDLKEVDWLKALLYILVCGTYVGMLELGFGYIVATPICLFLMIKFTGVKGWVKLLLTTVLVTALFYGVFHMIMGVYLPRFELF